MQKCQSISESLVYSWLLEITFVYGKIRMNNVVGSFQLDTRSSGLGDRGWNLLWSMYEVVRMTKIAHYELAKT